MDPDRLRQLLQGVSSGESTVEAAFEQLRDLPFSDLGHTRLDTHRALRCGFPEVVFGSGKRPDELVAIAAEIAERHGRLLVTRVGQDDARALQQALPAARYDALARAVWLAPDDHRADQGGILVASAGTSDGPVAREAALTATLFGARVDELRDVGVAGLHRLLAEGERLRAARVVVVVAGMEGALASVVGGLVDRPVVACPTSVGYGASFGGLAALLAMLNSCAAGVTVVNIDNGFGAGYAAALMNRLPQPDPPPIPPQAAPGGRSPR
jgi:NCAIR mutase (PurE)-related protein